MLMPLSIRTKIALWYLLVTGILLLIFSLIACFLLTDSLSRNLMHPQDMRIADMTAVSEGKSQVTALQELSDTSGEGRYNILSISGTRLLDMADESGMIEITLPRTGNSGGYSVLLHRDTLTENGTLSGEELTAWLYFSAEDASDTRLLIAVRPQESVSLITGMYRQTIIVAALITFVIAALFCFIITYRQMLPLTGIIDRIRNRSRANTGQQFDVTRKDEAGELAEALNRLLARTEEHLDRERRITTDISHELKMPLAIARAEASLALTRERKPEEYRSALENISREIMYLSSLIDKLLFLAKTENGSGINGEPLNLMHLLNELVPDAEILCEMKDQTFNTVFGAGTDEIIVSGDAVQLRQLLLNLIDNAVRYTPSGGTITLSFERQDSRAKISVQDTGAGIAPGHLPYIFDRFYRAGETDDSGRTGAGLGLAICRLIAHLHHGEIFVTSKPGKGSTFTLILPLVDVE
jgi:signal transduction histidine kinase